MWCCRSAWALVIFIQFERWLWSSSEELRWRWPCMNIGTLIFEFNTSFHIFFINQQQPQSGMNAIFRDLVKESNSPMVGIDPLRKQLLKFNLGAIVYTRVQNLGRITKMGSCPGNWVCIIQDGRWQERYSRKTLLSLKRMILMHSKSVALSATNLGVALYQFALTNNG